MSKTGLERLPIDHISPGFVTSYTYFFTALCDSYIATLVLTEIQPRLGRTPLTFVTLIGFEILLVCCALFKRADIYSFIHSFIYLFIYLFVYLLTTD